VNALRGRPRNGPPLRRGHRYKQRIIGADRGIDGLNGAGVVLHHKPLHTLLKFGVISDEMICLKLPYGPLDSDQFHIVSGLEDGTLCTIEKELEVSRD
jgi:hypothetical protein